MILILLNVVLSFFMIDFKETTFVFSDLSFYNVSIAMIQKYSMSSLNKTFNM